MPYRVTTRGRWVALAGILLAVSAVMAGLALRAPADRVDATAVRKPAHVAPVARSPLPAPTPAATRSAVPTPEATRTAVPAPEPLGPGHLTIGSIGVSTDLVRLGLNADRTVEVPTDPDRAGWFDLGPYPGELGSAVVLGHVDSIEGPAVFHELSRLQPGDTIEVTLTGGLVANFRVERVATYANEDFPAQEVYAGDPERRALNLVTCGGDYDAARGGWQSNVVVFAEYVGTSDAP